MLIVFTEDAPKHLQMIHQGIKDKDHEAIRKQAHALKSSVDLLNMTASMTTVRQIEEMAQEKAGIEKIEYLYLSMKNNISEVIEAIHKDLTA